MRKEEERRVSLWWVVERKVVEVEGEGEAEVDDARRRGGFASFEEEAVAAEEDEIAMTELKQKREFG